MKYTVLCPNWFFSNHLGDVFGTLPMGVIAYPLSGEAEAAPVDPRDVGELAAQMMMVSDPSAYHGLKLDVSGPEKMSMLQLATLYTAELGRLRASKTRTVAALPVGKLLIKGPTPRPLTRDMALSLAPRMCGAPHETKQALHRHTLAHNIYHHLSRRCIRHTQADRCSWSSHRWTSGSLRRSKPALSHGSRGRPATISSGGRRAIWLSPPRQRCSRSRLRSTPWRIGSSNGRRCRRRPPVREWGSAGCGEGAGWGLGAATLDSLAQHPCEPCAHEADLFRGE